MLGKVMGFPEKPRTLAVWPTEGWKVRNSHRHLRTCLHIYGWTCYS